MADDGVSIASKDLASCVTPVGITAGQHHFVDLWARDSLFATFGLYSKNELSIAKTTLETFLKYQRHDGLIPYRVLRSKVTFLKYFGIQSYLSYPKPDFRSHQSGGIVPDGGLMVVIAAAEYVRRSGDREFLETHYQTLSRAINWYTKRFHTDLIREWYLCEWADSVFKSGRVLYTNILYWRALGDSAKMATLSKNIADAHIFSSMQETIAAIIQKNFWTGTYFADWVDRTRHNYFAVFPNMLAIVFGFASNEQAESILAYSKKYCWNGWAMEENYPRYPWWRIPPWNYLAGVADYHNRGVIWLQPTILYAMALSKIGKRSDAQKVLNGVADKIIEYNGVYEIYEKNGRPVSRLYKSEHPFAWSAGLFLWANKKIVK